MTGEATEVWGVAVLASKQKAAATNHCFGDCGKISIAGVVHDEKTGGLFICPERTCPYEDQVLRDYGRADSFGVPHIIHLRVLRKEK